jgi:hypothetical protein
MNLSQLFSSGRMGPQTASDWLDDQSLREAFEGGAFAMEQHGLFSHLALSEDYCVTAHPCESVKRGEGVYWAGKSSHSKPRLPVASGYAIHPV